MRKTALFQTKFDKMDKLNENTREKHPVKLGEINLTPIVIALLVGFIIVGKYATPRR